MGARDSRRQPCDLCVRCWRALREDSAPVGLMRRCGRPEPARVSPGSSVKKLKVRRNLTCRVPIPARIRPHIGGRKVRRHANPGWYAVLGQIRVVGGRRASCASRPRPMEGHRGQSRGSGWAPDSAIDTSGHASEGFAMDEIEDPVAARVHPVVTVLRNGLRRRSWQPLEPWRSRFRLGSESQWASGRAVMPSIPTRSGAVRRRAWSAANNWWPRLRAPAPRNFTRPIRQPAARRSDSIRDSARSCLPYKVGLMPNKSSGWRHVLLPGSAANIGDWRNTPGTGEIDAMVSTPCFFVVLKTWQ